MAEEEEEGGFQPQFSHIEEPIQGAGAGYAPATVPTPGIRDVGSRAVQNQRQIPFVGANDTTSTAGYQSAPSPTLIYTTSDRALSSAVETPCAQREQMMRNNGVNLARQGVRTADDARDLFAGNARSSQRNFDRYRMNGGLGTGPAGWAARNGGLMPTSFGRQPKMCEGSVTSTTITPRASGASCSGYGPWMPGSYTPRMNRGLALRSGSTVGGRAEAISRSPVGPASGTSIHVAVGSVESGSEDLLNSFRGLNMRDEGVSRAETRPGGYGDAVPRVNGFPQLGGNLGSARQWTACRSGRFN